jgi:hypothetical protein
MVEISDIQLKFKDRLSVAKSDKLFGDVILAEKLVGKKKK